MALSAVPEKERTNAANPHLVSLFEGLQGFDKRCPLDSHSRSTHTLMLKNFAIHGLVRINPLGEKFNPNMVLFIYLFIQLGVL